MSGLHHSRDLPLVDRLSKLLAVSEIDRSNILKHIKDRRFHPSSWSVRGAPERAFGAEEGDEENQTDGTDEHGS
jgi:hypothetical protein